MPLAAIPKPDLFDRLAAGRAAGLAVLTPNRRLAQDLAREFDAAQARRGLAAWETADILPAGAFLERGYEDALVADGGEGLPQLLAPAQEQALWESVLAQSGLLAIPAAAAQCADAWRLAHAWGIDKALEKFDGGEDARAFAGWSRDYARRCRDAGFTDAARLPALGARLLSRKPKQLVAYGFDILTPQLRDFLALCAGEGIAVAACGPEPRRARAIRAAFASPRHELQAAAQWARARLEANPSARIGVVVPDLQLRRREVARVFARAMQPAAHLPGAAPAPLPFNLSLGAPLADYPVVHAALAILEASLHALEFERWSRLLRSPFLAGAEAELAARARLDERLRRRLPARATLPRLIGEIGQGEACPLLRAALEKLHAVAQEAKPGAPHALAQQFTALLDAAGFPGERTADSAEFQARARFNALLAEFSRLGAVLPRLAPADALARLRRLCAETLFQPESPDAPIQVLGVLESAGLAFDHLWVGGLTEDAWPLAARPNPFLPAALQKKAGIPEAAAETSLELDRRITKGWSEAAAEVVFSFPMKDGDRDLTPSPLISIFPPGKIETHHASAYRDLIHAARRLESLVEGDAPHFAGTTVKGGTRVLTDQSACPFRAFARHRLGAQSLESPAEGLDAAGRGQLLHALMSGLWARLKDSATLASASAQQVERAIDEAAGEAIAALDLDGPFAALERARLARLAREWLEVERERPAFEVVAREEKRALRAGGLEFSGRIDRMDRLADGTHALIDYKTSNQLTPRMWMDGRPEDPQLPLYAVSAGEAVSAVAFARLRAGGMRFMGYAQVPDAIPKLQRYDDWDSLLAGWRQVVDDLAQGFEFGDARVDPKNGLATCARCDLQTLCRVYEKVSPLSIDEEQAE
jgi:probable DNA repair protein